MELKKILELTKQANLTPEQKYEVNNKIDDLILSTFCSLSKEDKEFVQKELKKGE